ncbi:hypothetical protein TRIUR3_27029 [Triticum urartu]|uniref:Uncharacterized protein n=1 Tax=Triticum urartu TaxID=4572 RepID=M8A0E6_TRIUA|nr:hypothetical protein TRIUR3_27029 [Triticum urartu]
MAAQNGLGGQRREVAAKQQQRAGTGSGIREQRHIAGRGHRRRPDAGGSETGRRSSNCSEAAVRWQLLTGLGTGAMAMAVVGGGRQGGAASKGQRSAAFEGGAGDGGLRGIGRKGSRGLAT